MTEEVNNALKLKIRSSKSLIIYFWTNTLVKGLTNPQSFPVHLKEVPDLFKMELIYQKRQLCFFSVKKTPLTSSFASWSRKQQSSSSYVVVLGLSNCV